MTHHRRHHRRHNPAGFTFQEFAYGGAGVLAGFFGSAGLTQMFLGGGNTGMTGYAVTLGTGIGLAIVSHMVFPRQRFLTFGIGAGTLANLFRRIAQDYTPYGSYLSSPSMGDYMVANWGSPLMVDGLSSAMGAPYGTNVAASSGINMLDYADIRSAGARPC